MNFNSNILQLKREIKNLCDIDLWDNLSFENVKIWLKQFQSDEEKLLGHLIVRNLIVRNDKQMTQLLLQAIRRSINYFVKEEDRYRFSWQQILIDDYNHKKFYMGPVNFNTQGFGIPGKSGEIIIPLLRKYVPRGRFQYPDLYVDGLRANEGYFLIDDAILSGQQIEECISRLYSRLMLTPDASSALVVGIAHEEALRYLKEKLPNLKVFYGELLKTESSFTNLCEKWINTSMWPSHYPHPMMVYEDICLRANFAEKHHLGHVNQALLLCYSYGTPDNTIQILRDNSLTWSRLVSR